MQLKLDQGNSAFRTNGKVLIPDPKLKSGILDALAEEIINYKAYPSDSEFSDVAEALTVFFSSVTVFIMFLGKYYILLHYCTDIYLFIYKCIYLELFH